jgi:uncharacterized protein YndB with AHSA1/START domain
MTTFAPRPTRFELISDPMTSLVFDVVITAPMARVFAALTEAPLLTRWFCDRAESEARAGGRIELGWKGVGAESFAGDWTVFAPVYACAYVGEHSGPSKGHLGLVEFALESSGEGTALAVRHTYPSRPEYEAIAGKYGSAWPRALARLEALLATPTDREQGT